MPQPVSFTKCVCQHCGGHIEFPVHGAGQKICCPHCDKPTLLSLTPTEPVKAGDSHASRKRIFLGIGLAICVVAAAAIMVFRNLNLPPKSPQVAPTNITPVVVAPPPPPKPPPDPWHGLKASQVTLEKSEDGRLVYAIGMLKNDTTRQRFGVKVELDVLDEYREKLGTATDYTDVIEPGKEWKFRAMITDKTAVAAKLTKVREQE